ncbi:uncharacterized protein LOC131801554 [Musca domestica]|uniref:Uncharacterized protein LOC131801554 n=1 Tax=Musca domestica TaxID=7370 RepID=A0ABM3URZ7_MUSDO|nr:uncharacterized protein LOC131801554 [Musca domestica]
MIMVMVLRIFLFIGFCVAATCGESYLKITKIVCETHPSFIHNHSCALKPVNRYKTFILMDCWIKTQLRNSSVNLALYVRNSANIYKPFVINATINVCQLFAKSTQGAYGKIIKTIFSRFTNINHSCPFSIIFGETILKSTKIVCETHPNYIHNHTCALKPINRYRTYIQMDCWIKKELTNTSVNFAVYTRNSANIYKPFLINATINVCQLYAKNMQGPYGKILKTIFTRFTNINHSCPYSGNIVVKNAYWDTSLLPVALPPNSYKIVLTFYEDYPKTNYGFVAYYIEYIDIKAKPRKG